jgi:hypothetical protein
MLREFPVKGGAALHGLGIKNRKRFALGASRVFTCGLVGPLGTDDHRPRWCSLAGRVFGLLGAAGDSGRRMSQGGDATGVVFDTALRTDPEDDLSTSALHILQNIKAAVASAGVCA